MEVTSMKRKSSHFMNLLQQHDKSLSVLEIKNFTVNWNGRIMFIIMENGDAFAYGYDDWKRYNRSNIKKFTKIEELNNKNVVNICTGYNHAIAWTANGELYGWGGNDDGQLGLGHTNQVDTPTLVTRLNVAYVKCGWYFTVICTKSGEVYSFGQNYNGEMSSSGGGASDVSTTKILKPTHIAELNNIVAVECGISHSLALDTYGDVFAWGNNWYGKLGTGDQAYHNTPTRIHLEGGKKMMQIACGNHHSLVLSVDEQIYAFGSNSCCQCSSPKDVKEVLTPKRIVIKENGREVTFKSIAAVRCLSIAMSNTGNCYVWGRSKGSKVFFSSDPFKTDLNSIEDVISQYFTEQYAPLIMEMGKNLSSLPKSVACVLGSPPKKAKTELSFDDPDKSDFRIVVDGKVIHLSRELLRSRSDYMRTMLSAGWCHDNQVELNKYPYATYYSYLRYVCTDELVVASTSDAMALYDLARFTNEVALQRACIQLLTSQVSADNWHVLFEFAVKFKIVPLESHVTNYFNSHHKPLMNSAQFKGLSDRVARKLLMNHIKSRDRA